MMRWILGLIDHSYSSKFFERGASGGKVKNKRWRLIKAFLRCPDLNSEEDILRLELNTTSFKNNYLYEPITLDQYKAKHSSLKGIRFKFIIFHLDKNLAPRGYVYNFLEGDCLITAIGGQSVKEDFFFCTNS